MTGCNPAKPRMQKTNETETESISSVPLRLWIVSQVSDASMVERQWRTGSDQPLEIRALSVSEFLAEPSCACDVVVFPARTLGELIDRKWVIKLPAALSAPSKPEEGGSVQPVIWQKQVAYNGDIWGIPLGVSVPVLVVSQSDQATLPADASWDELLSSLKTPELKSVAADVAQVDHDALVDRFFAILGGLVRRPPEYGLLFELQTMKPRLTEPEFLRAANILAQLSAQEGGEHGQGQSVVGDFSTAWSWVANQSTAAAAIVVPSMLTAEAAQQSNCRALRVPPDAMAWNTGSGLIASISADCRQSTRATVLLRWLGLGETRQALAALILGVESAAPLTGSESAAWQAAGLAREMAAGERVTSELRLARSEEYRRTLAEHLLDVISGKSSAADALAATSETWQAITESRGRLVQRGDYERSLGLARD